MPARPAKNLLADGALFAATAVWGATFVVVRDALEETSPLLFVATRFTLAALVLTPLLPQRPGVFKARPIRAGSIVGLWLFLGFGFQTSGLVTTPPARAAFLTGLTVVLVPVLLVAFYHRLPTMASMTGVVLATAGLALLTGAGRGGLTGGDLLVLSGAAAFAFQLLAVHRYTAEIDPLHLLFWELATVAILAWPAAMLFETVRWPATSTGWYGVVVTALFATLGALAAQNWAQRRTPPTRAAVILTAEPVFAAAVSYVATGERFGATAIAGSALILSGMLAAELLPRPRERP